MGGRGHEGGQELSGAPVHWPRPGQLERRAGALATSGAPLAGGPPPRDSGPAFPNNGQALREGRPSDSYLSAGLARSASLGSEACKGEQAAAAAEGARRAGAARRADRQNRAQTRAARAAARPSADSLSAPSRLAPWSGGAGKGCEERKRGEG